MRRALIAAIALTTDLALGEPPSRLHPVVAIGKTVSFLERKAPKHGPQAQLLYGIGMAKVAVGAFAAAAWAISRLLRGHHPVVQVLVEGFLLKTTFSVKNLFQEARKVQQPLQEGDVIAAREALRSLVSRDTSTLDEPLIVSAAVESVAENLADSVVAPLLYYAWGGLPAAVAYRAINTMDAMIGYHGRYEYLGKTAARLDDAANFLPSRLTALLIVGASALAGADAKGAWCTLLYHRNRTESPNAGWPMSAMAGALGVELEKPGHYRLGEPQKALSPGRIEQALGIARGAVGLGAGLYFGFEVLRGVRNRKTRAR